MELHIVSEANRCLNCKKPMCQQGISLALLQLIKQNVGRLETSDILLSIVGSCELPCLCVLWFGSCFHKWGSEPIVLSLVVYSCVVPQRMPGEESISELSVKHISVKPGDVPRGIDGSRGIQFTVMLSIFCRVSSGAVR